MTGAAAHVLGRLLGGSRSAKTDEPLEGDVVGAVIVAVGCVHGFLRRWAGNGHGRTSVYYGGWKEGKLEEKGRKDELEGFILVFFVETHP